MYNAFVKYVKRYFPEIIDGQSLVASSSGVDSMVLIKLLEQAKWVFSVLHCNFKLRGKESDTDELFLKSYCKNNKIPFSSKSFDTWQYANQQNISVQLAARRLRYEWFKRQCNGKHKVLTAHHLNDSLETVIYNLCKGTGVAGLSGISARSDYILRPLLNFSKEEIESFAKLHLLKWRDDSSNQSDKYNRNKIRHYVIPVLKEVNPGLEKTMINTLKRIGESEDLLKKEVLRVKESLLKVDGEVINIELAKLKRHVSLSSILFELIREFGFVYDQVIQILEIKENTSGQRFLSNSHELLINRGIMIIRKINSEQSSSLSISKECTHLIWNNELILFKILDINTKISLSKQEAFLDMGKLKFPLLVRNWKKGDKMQSLGMKGKIKLSDLFINEKISLNEKKRIPIFISDDKIIWVGRLRIAETCKIIPSTKKIFHISLQSNA